MILPFTMKSNCDGLFIHGAKVVPEGEVKGIVQISHGMAEHKERYYDFMEYLASQGYVAMITDHRGHGESVVSKDDLGYFYDETGRYIVDDIHQGTLWIKNQYPNVPMVLFGHSMGSLVVRQYVRWYANDIDKLIVCGSPSKNPAIGVALGLVSAFTKVKGDHYRPALIQNMAFGGFNKKFHSDIPNAWLSENKQNVFEYNNDEYCGFTFTCNGFKNLFILMSQTYDETGWNRDHLDLPIFFVAGENDPCIENEQKWMEAQSFMKSLGYENIEKHLYPNMRHEILLEEKHMVVYEDILEFIKK